MQISNMTYQDDLEKHLLVDLHELLIPLVDVRGLAAGVVIVTSAGRVAFVVGAPFNHLAQNCLVDLHHGNQYYRNCRRGIWKTHVGNGNSFVRLAQVFEHVLDEDRTLRNIAL